MNKLRAQGQPKDIGVGLSSTAGKSKSMSLRHKTRLLFGIALTGLLGVLYVASSNILLGSLKKAEEQDTRQIVKGVLGVFVLTQEDYDSRVSYWSVCDNS